MQTLSETWKLAIDPANVGRDERWFEKIQKETQDAPVPGIIQQVFPDYHGVVWYWTYFTPLRTAKENERCLLAFEAVDYLAEVWVNGTPVGGHEGADVPFSLDVTRAVRPGEKNLLAVRVLNPTEEFIDGYRLDRTPHRSKIISDYRPGWCYNYGGILGKVELTVVPAVRVVDVFARPDVKTGEIRVTVAVQNDTDKFVTGGLEVLAGPADGGEVADNISIPAEFKTGQSRHEISLKIQQPRLWNLDDPFMYRVEVKLSTDFFCHQKMVRCGFRELRVEKGYFRLNGKRILFKSTHTGNHFPICHAVPPIPDLMRRDFLMAKVAGYNCVRFIAGMALAQQLDYCDEIGLMVYEESQASWQLQDSPDFVRRYDSSVREMILRDRNHPCVTIWGLLNETLEGAVFRHAVGALPMVRELDDTRMVMLNTGRSDSFSRPADGSVSIGSFSNPGSMKWEYEWGAEDSGPVDPSRSHGLYGPEASWYYDRMGDIHIYPAVTHPPEMVKYIRTVGKYTRPVLLGEYGIGSMLDVIRGTRWFEQMGAGLDLPDSALFKSMAEKMEADWEKWGFEGVYAFAGDVLRESQRLHVTQRLHGFDMIRSNPKICGYNVTGMLDHGITGEGVWTFWREWKPGSCEGLADGWAPLRWCLFVNPIHGYSNKPFTIEAVLANEDVLGPGEYPVTLKISGSRGTVWTKKILLNNPKPAKGEEASLAVPVFCGEVKLGGKKGLSGEYELSAYMEKDGAPFGGRLKFHISDSKSLPKIKQTVRLCGVDKKTEKWIKAQGIGCKPFGEGMSEKREVILVGDSPELNEDFGTWESLARQMAMGNCVIFLSPKVFKKPPFKSKIGRLERKMHGIAWREFEVSNVPKEEWPVFSKEFYGNTGYVMTKLPEGEYSIELGMCEGLCALEGERIFHVQINGEVVLKDFDIIKEAGGPHRAVVRSFKARPKDGKIEINFVHGPINGPSLSRIRIFDDKGELIVEDSALKSPRTDSDWLPLVNKGRCYSLHDDLYHKETVAKAHPVFEGLPNKGIMDWDYYGPVNALMLFDGQDPPADVAAAAFGTGLLVKGGYASGLVTASYPFGKGRFIINSLRILENLGLHPAADRLMMNMINYAAGFCKGPKSPLPANFTKVLKSIKYLD
jgi:hypothetical protein